MTIRELINEGERIASISFHRGEYVSDYYSGPEYQNWLSLAIRFVEQHFPNDTDTKRFRKIAEKANGNQVSMFTELIAILKAFDCMPPTPIKPDILLTIKQICENFNLFDIAIRRRYGNGKRTTIIIEDEHDLQDALHAILRLFVKDIRPEDYVPSYAGGNSRVDFLLPEYGIIIETKMTNTNLKDKEVGEQLIIDFDRYKQTKGYSHLICFVYDKEGMIANPHGLISDLEKKSDSELQMTVIVSP